MKNKKKNLDKKIAIKANINEIKSEPIIMETVIQEAELKTEIPKIDISTSDIKTLNSSSMLDDLMSQTDKDNEPENEKDNFDYDEDYKEPIKSDSILDKDFEKTESKLTDKIHDTLTNDGEDWQNPTDFRKMCAVNAMMYVEAGSILLSFIGQIISGDWSSEGEKKYMPSEDRRKLIRAPLSKKFELNKDKGNKTPTGALLTAILFTIIPVIIIAFKDRKQRVANELINIENIALKNQLRQQTAEMEGLRNTNNNTSKPSINKPLEKFLIKKRGRHKTGCDCEKCNLKRIKSK